MSVQPDPQTPTLTEAFQAAAYAYWRDVWGCASNREGIDAEVAAALTALGLDPLWSVERLRQVIARGLAVERERRLVTRLQDRDVSYGAGWAAGHDEVVDRLMAAGDEQS